MVSVQCFPHSWFSPCRNNVFDFRGCNFSLQQPLFLQFVVSKYLQAAHLANTAQVNANIFLLNNSVKFNF